MGKRVSGGGGGSALKKGNNAKTGPVAKLPHVAKITDWFFGFENLNLNVKIKSVVLLLYRLSFLDFVCAARFTSIVAPQGGPDRWLMQKYKTKDDHKLDVTFSLAPFSVYFPG